MTPDRLKRLVDCYGESPRAWPEEEREAAQALLQLHPGLLSYIKSEAWLDAVLNQVEPFVYSAEIASVKQRILLNLPEQPRQQPAREIATTLRNKWRLVSTITAFAASLMLALVLWHPVSPSRPSYDIAQNQFEQWTWDDTIGNSKVEETTSQIEIAEIRNPVLVGMLEMGFSPVELSQQ